MLQVHRQDSVEIQVFLLQYFKCQMMGLSLRQVGQACRLHRLGHLFSMAHRPGAKRQQVEQLQALALAAGQPTLAQHTCAPRPVSGVQLLLRLQLRLCRTRRRTWQAIAHRGCTCRLPAKQRWALRAHGHAR